MTIAASSAISTSTMRSSTRVVPRRRATRGNEGADSRAMTVAGREWTGDVGMLPAGLPGA